MKTLFTILVLFILTATTVFAENITLMWEPSPSPDVIGYAVHYDQVVPEAGQPWQVVKDVGNVLTLVIPKSDFAKGLWHFAVTAYSDTAESDFSNVVDFDKPGFVVVEKLHVPKEKPVRVIVTVEID